MTAALGAALKGDHSTSLIWVVVAVIVVLAVVALINKFRR